MHIFQERRNIWIAISLSTSSLDGLLEANNITILKLLNSANKNQDISKWSPPGEIRVWQLPLFTYLFIENEKVSKDKYTNFILAILPSDQPLAETQTVKPVKRSKENN